MPATSTAGTAPPTPSNVRAGLQLPPLITVLGIGLLVVGFLSAVPILLTLGLVVLVVGLVLMAKERWGSATSKAAGAVGGTKPAPDVPKTPETAQPADSKNRQLKVALAVAVAIVLAGVAINRIGIPFWQHSIYPRFFEKGSSAPASGSPGSQQSQSPYYQEGYDSGTSGLARKGYGDNTSNTGATVAEMEHQACASAINSESNYSSLLEPAAQDNYMDGCLNAFRDHPPAAKPKPGPLNPYR